VKFLNDILTGKDNLTYDAARVVGVLGAAAYIAFWAVQVAGARHFAPSDADAYGRGLAVVLLAMAGAVAIKRSTEPDPDSSPAPLRERTASAQREPGEGVAAPARSLGGAS
jgi:hypothetical protein